MHCAINSSGMKTNFVNLLCDTMPQNSQGIYPKDLCGIEPQYLCFPHTLQHALYFVQSNMPTTHIHIFKQ